MQVREWEEEEEEEAEAVNSLWEEKGKQTRGRSRVDGWSKMVEESPA